MNSRMWRRWVCVVVPMTMACRVAYAPLDPSATGSMLLSVATSGASMDPDGYWFTLDGEPHGFVRVNGSRLLSGLRVRRYTVTLDGVARNCTASPARHVVDVIAGETVGIGFGITCLVDEGKGDWDYAPPTDRDVRQHPVRPLQ